MYINETERDREKEGKSESGKSLMYVYFTAKKKKMKSRVIVKHFFKISEKQSWYLKVLFNHTKGHSKRLKVCLIDPLNLTTGSLRCTGLITKIFMGVAFV